VNASGPRIAQRRVLLKAALDSSHACCSLTLLAAETAGPRPNCLVVQDRNCARGRQLANVIHNEREIHFGAGERGELLPDWLGVLDEALDRSQG